MKRFMVDIEGLGKGKQGLILSIGVARFNLEEVTDTLEVRLNIDDQFDLGRVVDGPTIEWWLTQPGKPWRDDTPRQGVVPALNEVNRFIGKADEVWAKPPQYDLDLIRNAMGSIGLGPSWHYRAERCLKTIFHSVANPNLIDWPVRQGTHHGAADDAAHQARECITVLNFIRGGN